jgi:outer membrane biosynthesis protein TonB
VSKLGENWDRPEASTDPGDSARGSRRPLIRYGAALVILAGVFVGGYRWLFSGDDLPPPVRLHEITIINVPQPPPPSPPPPPEQKMIEQPKMAEQEFKEEKSIEKPQDEPIKDAKSNDPPGPLSLDAQPTGPGDLFNLGGKPGGSPFGGGGGGSRWGWYASIVQAQIESALRANEKTRRAVMQVQIRLWADATGRVNRVQLVSSTGDAELDQIIRNEVLGSLTLREPPPRDMPMPMVTRVTARRPS